MIVATSLPSVAIRNSFSTVRTDGVAKKISTEYLRRLYNERARRAVSLGPGCTSPFGRVARGYVPVSCLTYVGTARVLLFYAWRRRANGSKARRQVGRNVSAASAAR